MGHANAVVTASFFNEAFCHSSWGKITRCPYRSILIISWLALSLHQVLRPEYIIACVEARGGPVDETEHEVNDSADMRDGPRRCRLAVAEQLSGGGLLSGMNALVALEDRRRSAIIER